MCKVYNSIGCLTVIKAHLNQHNINEYKSVCELINFQKNYAFSRQVIISNHERLILKEKDTLRDEIAEIDISIKAKKEEVEQALLLDIGNLEYRLNNLTSVNSNIVQALINYVKKIILKLNIKTNKLTFNLKFVNSLKYLTDNYEKKNNRYQYIDTSFNDAVNESSFLQVQEIELKKRIIDQINNSIYGAVGEQKVVRELEKLSEAHILINDFNCKFHPPIYKRKENDYIKSIQIDHILLAPSGIFLIETKNWSQLSIENANLYSPVQQIKRTNFALYKILNEEIISRKLNLYKHYWGDRKIPIRNLIVFINHKPVEEFQHVKILTLDDLLGYVNYFKPCFSINELQTIASYLLNITG